MSPVFTLNRTPDVSLGRSRASRGVGPERKTDGARAGPVSVATNRVLLATMAMQSLRESAKKGLRIGKWTGMYQGIS